MVDRKRILRGYLNFSSISVFHECAVGSAHNSIIAPPLCFAQSGALEILQNLGEVHKPIVSLPSRLRGGMIGSWAVAETNLVVATTIRIA
jgi:hypothetical protein